MGKLDDIVKDNPMIFSALRGGLLAVAGATLAWDKIVAGDPATIGAVAMLFIVGALRAGQRNDA